MPLYEYKCRECGEVNEFLLSITNPPSTLHCEDCGSSKLEKMFSMVFFRSSTARDRSAPAGGTSTSKCSGCGGGSCSSCH